MIRIPEHPLLQAGRFFEAMAKGRYDLIPLDILHENILKHSQLGRQSIEQLGRTLSTNLVESSIEHLKKRKVRQVFIILGWCLIFLFIPAFLAWKSQKKNAQIDDDIRHMEDLVRNLSAKNELEEGSSSSQRSVSLSDKRREESDLSSVASKAKRAFEPLSRNRSVADQAHSRLSLDTTRQVVNAPRSLLRKERVRLVGIRNLGWQCYAIAALELFRFTPAFRHLTTRELPHSPHESDDQYLKIQNLQQAIEAILDQLDKGHVVDHRGLGDFFTAFQACLSPEGKRLWTWGMWQDSSEFLACLLDILKIDLPRDNACCLSLGEAHLLEGEKDTFSLMGPVLSHYAVYPLALVVDRGRLDPRKNNIALLLEAQKKSQAAEGHYRMKKSDWQTKLPSELLTQLGELKAKPVAKEGQATVQFEDDEGQWREVGRHTTQTFLMNTPHVLTLSLNRFKREGEHSVRLNGAVQIPLQLDIGPFLHESIPQGGSSQYELNSVVVHGGEDLDQGHYWIYQRLPSGTWICCDDDKVTICENFDPCKLEGSYLVVYQQKPSMLE